jgi:hypothetical protein
VPARWFCPVSPYLPQDRSLPRLYLDSPVEATGGKAVCVPVCLTHTELTGRPRRTPKAVPWKLHISWHNLIAACALLWWCQVSSSLPSLHFQRPHLLCRC